jgi:flagellar hook-associated protein 3 FlgL
MDAVLGLPDLLKTRRTTQDQNLVKDALDRAVRELSTGLKEDRVKASGGDTARLAALDRNIGAIEARQPVLAMSLARADAAQTAMTAIREQVADLGPRLMDTVTNATSYGIETMGAQAQVSLRLALGALNTQVSGRSVFGGALGAEETFASADDVIALVQAALTSDPDLTVALAAVDAIFAPGGDFDTQIYLGSTSDAPLVDIGRGERVNASVRGDDAETFRDLIKGMALAAALGGTPLADDLPKVERVFKAAGEAVIVGIDNLVKTEARLGAVEQELMKVQARDSAERTALSITRADLIGADIEEVSVRVKNLEAQLNLIYAVTARTMGLSFLNYMR